MAVTLNPSADKGVLGRGKGFVRFPGDTTWQQIGGINNFTFSNEVESVFRDDFSEEVVQEVQEANIKQTTTISLTVNAITDETAALFGLTKPSQIATSSQGVATGTVLTADAVIGQWTRLPVAGAVVTDISPNGGGTSLVEGTDYLVSNDMVKWGDSITPGQFDITYDTPAKTIKKTLSGQTATLEAVLLFKSNNAQGEDRDFEAYVNLKGTGDYGLVSNEFVEVALEGKALVRETETGFDKSYQLTKAE